MYFHKEYILINPYLLTLPQWDTSETKSNMEAQVNADSLLTQP